MGEVACMHGREKFIKEWCWEGVENGAAWHGVRACMWLHGMHAACYMLGAEPCTMRTCVVIRTCMVAQPLCRPGEEANVCVCVCLCVLDRLSIPTVQPGYMLVQTLTLCLRMPFPVRLWVPGQGLKPSHTLAHSSCMGCSHTVTQCTCRSELLSHCHPLFLHRPSHTVTRGRCAQQPPKSNGRFHQGSFSVCADCSLLVSTYTSEPVSASARSSTEGLCMEWLSTMVLSVLSRRLMGWPHSPL